MKPPLSEIHPDLRSIASKIPQFTFNGKTLWLLRLLMRLQRGSNGPADTLIENRLIPTQDNQTKIRLRLYRPKSMTVPVPVLLWLHGGGFILGKPEVDDTICIPFACELGIVIVSVDYRCAPEHPFPIPLEDSYAALKWVASQAMELGIDPNRIAIGGESAGAGLAAAVVQFAYDQKEVNIVFQLLTYPMLDDRSSTRPDVIRQGFILWNQASNRFGWKAYLGKNSGAAASAYAVPSRREDLSGLPPAWIGVGTLDLFHNEDVAYAQQLRQRGVPCEICEVPGAFHGFDFVAPQSQVVQDFRKSQIAALKHYLFPTSA